MLLDHDDSSWLERNSPVLKISVIITTIINITTIVCLLVLFTRARRAAPISVLGVLERRISRIEKGAFMLAVFDLVIIIMLAISDVWHYVGTFSIANVDYDCNPGAIMKFIGIATLLLAACIIWAVAQMILVLYIPPARGVSIVIALLWTFACLVLSFTWPPVSNNAHFRLVVIAGALGSAIVCLDTAFPFIFGIEQSVDDEICATNSSIHSLAEAGKIVKNAL